MIAVRLLICAALPLAFAGCGSAPAQIDQAQSPGDSRKPAVIVAAGDIACPAFDEEFRDGHGTDDACQQNATANLVADVNPDGVLVLGDSQYDYARAEEFRESYEPSWGQFLGKTHAAVGNHEYMRDPNARGFFEYFGSSAGPSTTGYYSFDLGAWHLIALNSNCDFVGGCTTGSKQERWLRRDLAENAHLCTLAFWHHPLFSSSIHGTNGFVRDLWSTLYEYRVDVVLNGHDHVYERFAPQDPHGNAARTGIRQFVVGSGGKEHYEIKRVRPNSEAHDDHTFGVLRMDLRRRDYSWSFLPIEGQQFTDAGHARCR